MPTLSGSLDITGSINVTGSIANNGAPVVTSTQTGSFVTNSQTGSFVTNSQTGSFVTNSQTGSFATTGSNTFNGNVTVTGSMVITGSLTISGSGTLTNIGPFVQTGTTQMTGPVTVTGGGITASLQGTASYALQSLSASYALQSLSASYAPSSPAFPYTGNAFITGSLAISGGLLLPTIPDNNAVVSPTYGYMNMFSRGGIHIYDPSVYNNKIIISNIFGMQTQLGCETFLMSNSDGNALSSWIASTTSGLTENTLYSAGTANLKIQSETQLILSGSSSKLILSSSAVTVTGSLRLTGSLSLANGPITMRTGSTSLTAGAGAINLQSGVIDRIPSLILASSNNSNTVKIGSYANDSHYITSSNNLTVIAPSLILQSGLHEVYGDMLLYNGITITGTTNVNGLMTLEPTHPLPSVINGSVAYSSSGDFYFASGSAWKKLTL